MWIVMFILLILSPIKTWAAEYSVFVCEVSQTCWVPVYLVDSADKVSGKTGITDTALTVHYAKENASSGTSLSDTKNCTSGNFCENDATNMAGFYWLKFTSSDVTASSGRWVVVMKASGILDAPIHVAVVPDLDIPMSDIASILSDTGTDGVKISSGTGTGQISLSSGTVTVGQINTDVITNASLATTAVDEILVIASGTEGAGTSTTLKVYTTLGVTNERKYNNMCLYSASNGERSRILSTGNGFLNVRGYSVAPTDGSVLKVYSDGCL